MNNTTLAGNWTSATLSTLYGGMTNSELSEINELEKSQVNLLKIFGILIIITGTLGHLITLLVLFRSLCRGSKGLVCNASGVYMIALSLSALVPLYTGLLRWVIRGFDWSDDLRDKSFFSCFLGSALSYFALQNFSWIQAAIAIDRLIAVLLPHRYPKICSTKIGIIVTCSILVVLLSINFGFHSQVEYTSESDLEPVCIGIRDNLQMIHSYVDLVLFALLPGAVMIPCNIAIMVNLQRMENRSRRNSRRPQHSLTTMLVSLNAIFIITTLPISIVSNISWGDYGTLQYARLETAWFACLLIQYLGTALTFFVYTLSGSKFREEMIRLQMICVHRPVALQNMNNATSRTTISNNNRQTVNSINHSSTGEDNS